MNATDHIWYPFTQMKTAAAPIHIERAENCTLYATDGKEYIDAISSWWVNIHGHAHPAIAAAIARQSSTLEHVIFAGFTHSPAIELAQHLLELLPDHFDKIFFSDDGSTAVEVAIKMAVQYWHNQQISRTVLLAFENAYHGDTFGAMSAGAKSTFNAAFQSHLFEVIHIPVPTKENIQSLQQQVKQLAAAHKIAAFIFEPLVQGSGGMLMHEAPYLDALLDTMKENEILCIADEVMTGFGRTGKNFATEYLNNQPDIICLSKGITGGFMALGVTACSSKIFDAFYAEAKEKTLYHGHSYTGNPLACAAANTSMQLLKSDACRQSIQRIVQQHKNFAEKIQDHPLVQQVRQQGTIVAVEIKAPEGTSYFSSIRDTLYHFYLDRGVLLRPLGNVVYAMPPYCITDEELGKIYTVILESLDFLQKTMQEKR